MAYHPNGKRPKSTGSSTAETGRDKLIKAQLYGGVK